MQPSRFIVIRDLGVRKAVHKIFEAANQQASASYMGERREHYSDLKLEGILEAPQNLCILCDPGSKRGQGLGSHTMPETALYFTVCAIQNLWLAARSEGVGSANDRTRAVAATPGNPLFLRQRLKLCTLNPPTNVLRMDNRRGARPCRAKKKSCMVQTRIGDTCRQGRRIGWIAHFDQLVRCYGSQRCVWSAMASGLEGSPRTVTCRGASVAS
jgi:hypothetical protein